MSKDTRIIIAIGVSCLVILLIIILITSNTNKSINEENISTDITEDVIENNIQDSDYMDENIPSKLDKEDFYNNSNTEESVTSDISDEINTDTDTNTNTDTEYIENTPIDEYEDSDYKGHIDKTKIGKKCKISDDSENGYQGWMFDYTNGGNGTIDLILRFYNTYCDNFYIPNTFTKPTLEKFNWYYGDSAYYIFNIDGADVCFTFDGDMEYVYISDVTDLEGVYY